MTRIHNLPRTVVPATVRTASVVLAAAVVFGLVAVAERPDAALASPLEIGAPGAFAVSLTGAPDVDREGWSIEATSTLVGCTASASALTDGEGVALIAPLALVHEVEGDRGPQFCTYSVAAVSPDGARQTIAHGASVVAARAENTSYTLRPSTTFVGMAESSSVSNPNTAYPLITNWGTDARRLDRFTPLTGELPTRFQSYQARCFALGANEGTQRSVFGGIAAGASTACARFTDRATRLAEQASLTFTPVDGARALELGPNLIGSVQFRGNDAVDGFERSMLRVDADVAVDGSSVLLANQERRFFQFLTRDGGGVAGNSGLATSPFNGFTSAPAEGDLLHTRVDLHVADSAGQCPSAPVGAAIWNTPSVLAAATDTTTFCLYSQWFLRSFGVQQLSLAINELPVLAGADDITLTVGDDFDPSMGVTATDAEDGDLTAQIVIDGVVDTSEPGVVVVRYTVEDSSGGVATVERAVRVLPAQAETELPGGGGDPNSGDDSGGDGAGGGNADGGDSAGGDEGAHGDNNAGGSGEGDAAENEAPADDDGQLELPASGDATASPTLKASQPQLARTGADGSTHGGMLLAFALLIAGLAVRASARDNRAGRIRNQLGGVR